MQLHFSGRTIRWNKERSSSGQGRSHRTLQQKFSCRFGRSNIKIQDVDKCHNFCPILMQLVPVVRSSRALQLFFLVRDRRTKRTAVNSRNMTSAGGALHSVAAPSLRVRLQRTELKRFNWALKISTRFGCASLQARCSETPGGEIGCLKFAYSFRLKSSEILKFNQISRSGVQI